MDMDDEAAMRRMYDYVKLAPGQIGELHVRGPQVMQGYWQDTKETAAVLDPDGWLHTNDVARMDEDGYFQIISRRQDMWTPAEEAAPAFPRDVEEVIYELPEVREAVVIAIANQPIAISARKRRKARATAGPVRGNVFGLQGGSTYDHTSSATDPP